MKDDRDQTERSGVSPEPGNKLFCGTPWRGPLSRIRVVLPIGTVTLTLLFLQALIGADVVQDASEPSSQERGVVEDPYPLQPPDTSSPRDTLRHFISNIELAYGDWLGEATDDWTERAWRSALSTLDFSAVSEKDSWSLQTEYALLLKEVLDHIELPHENQVPGDEEVENGNITEWTIPNTKLVIARVEDGFRAGEFLFSAGTVEGLFRSYRLVKDLPYKPTATTPGIYELYTSSADTLLSHERQLRLRLRRVETSNPRSTLRIFLDNVNRAYALIMEADEALKARPRTMTREKAAESERMADDHLRRAAATMDLSQIPSAHIKAASLEAVLKLKEILDRTVLPALEAVPDAIMVEAVLERDMRSQARASRPFRWTYPNTDVEIVEIMEGTRQGEFLFSASTVRQIDQFYESLQDLPYRSKISRAQTSKHAWSEISDGFYDYVFTNPGYLISRLSLFGRFVDSLPAGFKTAYGGMTGWEWLALMCAVLIAAVAAGAIVRMLGFIAGRLSTPADGWVMVLAPALIMLVVQGLKRFTETELHISGDVQTVVKTTTEVIFILLVIWFILKLCAVVAESVIASPRMRERSLDASLLRISVRVVALLIGGWILVVSVRNLGADLVPLLAGLGVGGLAVALAAQKTLANFIGSLILFANKPVKPGDFCRYGDQIGTVEHIGLLSTRIRSLERTIITVPNAAFSEMQLDNFAMRDRRLLRTVLQLRYETSSDQMRYVLAKLRELLLSHPKVTPDPARVRLVSYGAYSIDIEVFAYLLCQDQDTFLAIQEDVLLRMRTIIEGAGTGFAFPSQTAYLSRDKGLDPSQAEQAETKVEQWRLTGKLPFPEFGDEERERMADTLDYPPKGSARCRSPRSPADLHRERGPATLCADDFVDMAGLVTKLQEPTRMSNYLWGGLSVRTQGLLQEYNSETDAEAREALAQDLSSIIHGPSVYTIDRFSTIKRRPETEALTAENPTGDDLARLNRLLLEDAFPKEIARRPSAHLNGRQA
jgi:MscS family membrane protein